MLSTHLKRFFMIQFIENALNVMECASSLIECASWFSLFFNYFVYN